MSQAGIATSGWAVAEGRLEDVVRLTLEGEAEDDSAGPLSHVVLRPPPTSPSPSLPTCTITVDLSALAAARGQSDSLIQVSDVIVVSSASSLEMRVGREYAGTFHGDEVDQGVYAIEASASSCFQKAAPSLTLKLFGLSDRESLTVRVVDVAGCIVEGAQAQGGAMAAALAAGAGREGPPGMMGLMQHAAQAGPGMPPSLQSMMMMMMAARGPQPNRPTTANQQPPLNGVPQQTQSNPSGTFGSPITPNDPVGPNRNEDYANVNQSKVRNDIIYKTNGVDGINGNNASMQHVNAALDQMEKRLQAHIDGQMRLLQGHFDRRMDRLMARLETMSLFAPAEPSMD